MKFFHKFLNRKLPLYFQNMPFIFNENFHGINTRQKHKMHTNRVSHSFAEKCIRYSLAKLVNEISLAVFDKLFTHSFNGFSNYTKKQFILNYPENCEIVNCYICHRDQ